MHAKATSVGKAFTLEENNLGPLDSKAGDGMDLEFGKLASWRGSLGTTFRF